MRTLYFWCTSCYSKRQSRAETSAPPESVQLRVCVCYAFVTVRVRRPIGLRSPSDRIASAVRSDCVRCPIRLRSVPDEKSRGVSLIVAEVSGLRSTKSDSISLPQVRLYSRINRLMLRRPETSATMCCYRGRRPPLRCAPMEVKNDKKRLNACGYSLSLEKKE